MTLHVDMRGEADLARSLESTLAEAPAGAVANGVWLFVYGFLAVDPPFDFQEHRVAKLDGYRRSFCLLDPLNRGTPEAPGLVLGLEPGGGCEGIAFQIPALEVRTGLLAVWRQEMKLPIYVPEWRMVETTDERLTALVFNTNRSGALFQPSRDEVDEAAQIAGASGSAGSNREYLCKTREAFAAAGACDAYLDRLADFLNRR